MPALPCYHFTMNKLKNDVRQVAIRLTRDQWREVSHYITDKETSFQALIIKLLADNNIIK